MRVVFTLYIFLFSAFCFGQVNHFKSQGDTTSHRINAINDYAPIDAFNPCNNKIIIEGGYLFHAGDTVVIMQMKGAVIDSSNTSNFGAVTNYRNAGNYEFNFVKTVSGDTIELKNNLQRQYDIPDGKVQLIRVPSYSNLNTSFVITCDPWDGRTGGVVVLMVSDTLNLNEDVDVSWYGFRGGADAVIMPNTLACSQNGYYYDSSSWQNGRKGEGIADIGFDKWNGRGNLANGGGGGNGHNSGGGGGSNDTLGGFGGYQLDSCGNSPYDNGGMRGSSLNYNNNLNKIFMGGGGGAGQNDGINPFFRSEGGNGGGIIILKARVLITNNNAIRADGNPAATCAACNDGMGGGGAGGTVLMEVGVYLDSVTISAKGAAGSSVQNSPTSLQRVGPGGGGSGGVVWFRGNTPSLARINENGGINGVVMPDGNNPWGATAGNPGTVLNNLIIPYDTIPFRHNIDSVRIQAITTSCTSYDFHGLAYVNTFPIVNWQWSFGDGGTDIMQNTSHNYMSTGTFAVRLIATDSYGCSDSSFTSANSYFMQVDAGRDTTICFSTSVVLQATATGANQFSWTPAQWLNNSTLLNPVATPPVGTTKFYLVGNGGPGCSKLDSVSITVRPANSFSVNPSLSICKNDPVRLVASGGDIYLWSPGNQTIPNPVVSPQSTTNYSVEVTDTVCNNSVILSTTVIVNPLPIVMASKSNDIDCSNDRSQLNAVGAANYLWSPGVSLNDSTKANPIARPATTTQYLVKGTDVNGCVNYDTITVNITSLNKAAYLMPSAFSPNGDGLNDCYGIKNWGVIEELNFNIYDRWGELLFHTTKPSDCWEGIYKGQKQPADVYVYIITAKTSCGSVFKKGLFMLIR
jgi:gliding motility-associated-like protein